MKPYQKKKLLKQQIKKFLSKKKEILEAIQPIDKKLSRLAEKLAAVGAPLKSTVSFVDHAGGSYEVVEFGECEDQVIV